MGEQTEVPTLGNVMVLLILLFTLPLSLLLWTLTAHLYATDGTEDSYYQQVSPWRWLFAFLIPIYMAKDGYDKKKLDGSGAATALAVGFIMTLSNYCFMSSIIAFFLLGSKATKFRGSMKKKFEEDFKEGGQRNWMQVVCNAGFATQMALIFMLETSYGEYAIHFTRSYNTSWVCMSILGSIASSSGDTLASEIGSVVGKGKPFLITSLKRVPTGTNGGVSVVGLLCSFLGGLVVGLAYYLTLLLCIRPDHLIDSPPQWPIIIVGGLAGLVGSIIDSILGATFQYSGFDHGRGCIVEHPGNKVEHISGTAFLDNHSVNLVTSILMALVTPNIAIMVWGGV